LLFEKGVLLFEKGVLLFEKGVLLLENRDRFSYFCSGGVDKYLGEGGAAACFGRGLVATSRKAKENV
jgi:hypothetical protein